MNIDFNKMADLVAKDEEMLFHGCFNEATIRSDLATRRDKRDTYFQYYSKFIADHNNFLDLLNTHQAWDANLIGRVERCRNEALRLREIACSY